MGKSRKYLISLGLLVIIILSAILYFQLNPRKSGTSILAPFGLGFLRYQRCRTFDPYKEFAWMGEKEKFLKYCPNKWEELQKARESK